MSLIIMSSEVPSRGLSPSIFKWRRNSSKSPRRDESSPNPGGLLVPKLTSRSSESGDSRSTKSTSSRGRRMIKEIANRLRSSPSISPEAGPLQEKDFKQVEGWTNGFDKYNQLVTNQISKDQSYPPEDFAKICKMLTKKCGGHFVHGLPESVLDFALLWCPAEKMHRKPIGCTEPSWSWIGWEGAVNFPFDPTNCPDVRRAAGDYFRSEIGSFRVGPESAPYTMRRAMKEKDKLRIRYYNDCKPLQGVTPSLDESNTLRFNAYTISAESFSVEQLDFEGKVIPCSELLDDKNQQCGVLMDYSELITIPVLQQCNFEFVLLSRNRYCEPTAEIKRPASTTAHPSGTPIWDGERFVWDRRVNDFDEKYEEGEWCMLNVMLIQHMPEGFAERVAIARIHEKAWKACNPIKKNIVLK
ncbi:hypothetical protein K458DRAFT_289356 [Lentithecium fluviatile CBS 122367]|uniref:Uncharacterized protein n=1 Tax=Lentithecium fluviatile CBS 122367 TaxID=1168545 RepID=A0A6G1JHR0_9PLEO|nr:hypothetical protein K458DRAFT_289356 [Lentithecium fluviatile CBS 122367]